jgi:putative transposase
MSDQFWLTKAQLKCIEPFFPRTRGIPRVDDRRVVSGIVHVIRNGLRWRERPRSTAPTRRGGWGGGHHQVQIKEASQG